MSKERSCSHADVSKTCSGWRFFSSAPLVSSPARRAGPARHSSFPTTWAGNESRSREPPDVIRPGHSRFPYTRPKTCANSCERVTRSCSRPASARSSSPPGRCTCWSRRSPAPTSTVRRLSIPRISTTCAAGPRTPASGCANMIEIARSVLRLTDSGKIRRPRRDIQFWFAPEVHGEYAYFARFPEERERILININQELIGENQPKLGASAVIEQAPWSIPTYLNDVVEHFVRHVLDTNTGMINQYERFSDPLFAAGGSRDAFRAFMTPFFPTLRSRALLARADRDPGGAFHRLPELLHPLQPGLDPTTSTRHSCAATPSWREPWATSSQPQTSRLFPVWSTKCRAAARR